MTRKAFKFTTNFDGDLVCNVIRELVEFRRSAIVDGTPKNVHSSDEWVMGVVTKVDPSKGRIDFGEFVRGECWTQRLFTVMTSEGVYDVLVEGTGRDATTLRMF